MFPLVAKLRIKVVLKTEAFYMAHSTWLITQNSSAFPIPFSPLPGGKHIKTF